MYESYGSLYKYVIGQSGTQGYKCSSSCFLFWGDYIGHQRQIALMNTL